MRTLVRTGLPVAAITIACALATGCGRVAKSPLAPAADPFAAVSRTGTAPTAADTQIPPPFAPFDLTRFHSSTRIDNRWLPLTPGTQFVLDGVANRGGGLLPHRVIFTVTDVTKEIAGVRTVVVWDQDITEGVLVESELAFFAQDDAGNVWSMGEYPEEYTDGVFTGAPSTWIPGVAGALAGTMMPADPKPGSGYYLQGYSPDIAFLDEGKVFQAGQSTCVPAGCFDQVLITDEKSPLDPSGHQRKYYAPGVGNVQIGAVGDPEGETLMLTASRKLTARELREARRAVMKLEARAYQVSEVYPQTVPAQ